MLLHAAEGPPGSLAGRAVLRVSSDAHGRRRFDVVRSTPLVTLRPTAEAVYLVGAAATPLGGDRASLVVDVGPGTVLRVRSVAAAVARPGPLVPGARWSVRATVGTGAHLVWEVEPGVAAGGSTMESRATVDLARGARLWWRDEVVLGRAGEEPGSWSSSVHVERGGRPVLHHHVVLGPGWGPAVTGNARAVASVVVVGVPAPSGVVVRDGAWAAAMALADDDATLVSACGPGHPELRAVLRAVAAEPPRLTPPSSPPQ